MKPVVVAFIFILAFSFLLSAVSVNAGPAHVPHEDPLNAQSTMDPYSFLSQYAGILSFIASEQYDNASRLTQQLSHIAVPADLSYIISRYNNITQQLIGSLSDLRTVLDNASSLLSQNRLSEASRVLNNAGVLVARVQILLVELQDATATVSQRLGVFAAPAQSNIKQSYDALEGLLQKLNDLINRYHALLQSTKKQAAEIEAKQLVSTQLSLNLDSTTVFVGGAVKASGLLNAAGQVMQNRAVALLIDGTKVADVNTDSNGQYNTIFHVPYQYVNTMTVQALYAPTSSIDKETYLAGLSTKLSINILFYQTHLNITTPNVAYPGLSYTVNGVVTSQDGSPLKQRVVRLLFDEEIVGQVKTDELGLFTIESILNSQTAMGVHSLAANIDPEGLYSGVSQSANVSVTKVTSKLNVNVPSFVFLPSQVHVSGIASSASGPLKNAVVTLEFAYVSDIVTTMDDGSFNSTMYVPLSAIFAGTQNIKISVKPAESWQAIAQKNISVFVLNSVSTAVSLAASFSVCGVLYLRFAGSKTKKNRGKLVPDKNLEKLQSSATIRAEPSLNPEFKFEGVKGKVLEAYIKALRSIESFTGTVMNQDMTLREFLHLTEDRLGNSAYPFGDLTVLTERSIYSTHMPEEQDLVKAQGYADKIGRILKSENK